MLASLRAVLAQAIEGNTLTQSETRRSGFGARHPRHACAGDAGSVYWRFGSLSHTEYQSGRHGICLPGSPPRAGAYLDDGELGLAGGRRPPRPSLRSRGSRVAVRIERGRESARFPARVTPGGIRSGAAATSEGDCRYERSDDQRVSGRLGAEFDPHQIHAVRARRETGIGPL